MDLQALEAKALEAQKTSARKSSTITNKSILLDLLKDGEFTKGVASVKAATKYFEVAKIDPTESKYMAKIKSMGDAFDTMKSNFNSDSKIKDDKLLNGHEWIEVRTGVYTIK